MNISQYIDHTLLKANASPKEIKTLCQESIIHQFYAVCVNACNASISKKYLEKSPVKLAVVVGFPLGADTTSTKVFAASEAINNGADEIDMVINIAALKAGDYTRVLNDIKSVKKAIGTAILKVIIETAELSNDEKIKACEIILEAKADFVKTSTGFSTDGATVADILLLKNTVGNRCQIKASGGIKSTTDALELIDAGANRLGTSSGIQLINSTKNTIDESTY